MEVTGISEDPDNPVYTLSGPFPSLYRVLGGEVLEVAKSGERKILDLAAEPGNAWTIGPLDGGYDLWSGAEVTLASRSDVVDVPLGSFREVLHFQFSPPPGLADAGVTDLWLAPDVGLIQWSEIWIGGVRTLQLSGFRGGRDGGPDAPQRYANFVTREEGDRFYTLGLDRETYHHGERIQMRYDVLVDSEAGASDSVLYRFDTTQQIEFALTDSAGTRNWLWSEGRGFAEVLTAFTLGAGGRRRVDGDLLIVRSDSPVASRDQVALTPGRYRLEGFLPTSFLQPGGTPSDETVVSVPFEVLGEVATEVVVQGVVVEIAGRQVLPIPSATVRVSYLPLIRLDGGAAVSGPVSETVTDERGEYRIGGLIPGSYLVEVSREGWNTETASIHLRAGITPFRVAMARSDTEGLDNSNAWDHGRFRGELAVDKLQYSPEDTVQVRYRLIYRGEEEVTLSFTSGQWYDITLDGPRGRVWTWSDGMAFTQALGQLVMAPGDTFQVRESIVLNDLGAGGGGSYLLQARTTGGVRQEATGSLGATLTRPPEGAVDETAAAVKFIVVGDRPQPDSKGLTASLEFVEEFAEEFTGEFTEELTDEIAREIPPTSGSVTFVYRLTNTGADTIALNYPSSQEYDIVLEDSEGWVWVWSSTRLFAATRWVRSLAPGDSVVTRERMIPGQVGAVAGGSYVLRMYQALASSNGLGIGPKQTEARVSFRLPTDPDDPGGATRELAADFDGDRRVSFTDFLMFTRAFGKRLLLSDPDRKFDLDNDGRVGFEDFLLFAARFGEAR
jgi:hypothetical protein